VALPRQAGATTIWSVGRNQADGSFEDKGMNSFNHYAYGAVGSWMYQTLGGINIDPRALATHIF